MQKRLYWSITIVALQNQIHSYNSLQQFCFAKIIFFLFSFGSLGLCCCVGFSLAVESGGYSPVAVCGLLTVGASLVVEHGL